MFPARRHGRAKNRRSALHAKKIKDWSGSSGRGFTGPEMKVNCRTKDCGIPSEEMFSAPVTSNLTLRSGFKTTVHRPAVNRIPPDRLHRPSVSRSTWSFPKPKFSKRLLLAYVHVSMVLAIGSNQASWPNASVKFSDKVSSSDGLWVSTTRS